LISRTTYRISYENDRQPGAIRRRPEPGRNFSPMIRALVILAVLTAALAPAAASSSCTIRKSGSVTITTCSDTGHQSNWRQCRSYRSGGVVKTQCR
jgi:hypothetical protein